MATETLQAIAGYIAQAVPATVAISNFAKAILEWLKQKHTIKESQIQLSHQITTHYLGRALDPSVPLAIRHQLLRFHATRDTNGTRLSNWAESELKRVGGLVEETNRAVAGAIRAGLVHAEKLNGLEMKNQDLSGSDFVYRELRLEYLCA